MTIVELWKEIYGNKEMPCNDHNFCDYDDFDVTLLCVLGYTLYMDSDSVTEVDLNDAIPKNRLKEILEENSSDFKIKGTKLVRYKFPECSFSNDEFIA